MDRPLPSGDFDNDGKTDLFLTNLEGNNRLLRNTGEAIRRRHRGGGH